MLLINAYEVELQKIKSRKLQGFDVSMQADALQNAVSELFDHNFGNQEQATATLKLRYKARLIDLYRKDEKLDFVSDFSGHLEPIAEVENKIDPAMLIERAAEILADKDHYLFELFIEGWSGSDIGKILNIGRAAVSKRLARIIEKLKIDTYFVQLTEVGL